jgi:hypothetical protein
MLLSSCPRAPGRRPAASGPDEEEPERPPRCLRPSLGDRRFRGDAWIAELEEGICVVCLGDYRMVEISALTLDVSTLNRIFERLRRRPG